MRERLETVKQRRGSEPLRRALRASVTKETPGGQEATRKTVGQTPNRSAGGKAYITLP